MMSDNHKQARIYILQSVAFLFIIWNSHTNWRV